jgi:hypothetical protein
MQIDRDVWIDAFRVPARMAAWLGALVALMLLAFAAHAQEASVTWTHPTAYVDETPLALGEIESTEIEFGRCSDGGLATEPAPVSVTVPGPAAEAPGIALPDYGRWCFRARTIVAGVASEWTSIVSKDYPPPALPQPLPPGDLTAK